MSGIARNSDEQRSESKPRQSRRQDGQRYIPRAFSDNVRRSFDRDRRRDYLGMLGGVPSTAQSAKIDTLVRLEWAALKAEHEGTIAADREAREHRRLLDRLLGDFERMLKPPPPAKPATLSQHLRRLK